MPRHGLARPRHVMPRQCHGYQGMCCQGNAMAAKTCHGQGMCCQGNAMGCQGRGMCCQGNAMGCQGLPRPRHVLPRQCHGCQDLSRPRYVLPRQCHGLPRPRHVLPRQCHGLPRLATAKACAAKAMPWAAKACHGQGMGCQQLERNPQL
jgi:hypothetical protein